MKMVDVLKYSPIKKKRKTYEGSPRLKEGMRFQRTTRVNKHLGLCLKRASVEFLDFEIELDFLITEQVPDIHQTSSEIRSDAAPRMLCNYFLPL